MEPGSALEIGALGFAIEKAGGRELILKLLGPTFGYLGQTGKSLVQRGIDNVARVLSHAVNRLGTRVNEPGAVPPRVLRVLIEQAAFSEDALVAEYLGGVLAASRTENLADDAGISIAALLASMSAIQIRTHYLLYKVARDLHAGRQGINVGVAEGRRALECFIPFSVIERALPLSRAGQFDHALFGLGRLDLLEPVPWMYGDADAIRKHYAKAEDGGLVFTPSALGIELFLWAHGHADRDIRDYLDPGLTFELTTAVDIPGGSVATRIPRAS